MIIKGVFFDFFGTLIIPADMNLKWSEWFPSVYPLYKKNGIDIPRDSFNTICENFWSSIYNDHGNGISPFERRLISQFECFNILTTPGQISKLAFEISEAWFSEHFLDEEVVDLLKYLSKKLKIALITNYDHPPYIKVMLEKYKIADFFDSVIISGDVGVKKPEPEIFNPALSETGLSPEDVIYVGDSIIDFRAALGAGIRPVVIRREGQHDPSKPGDVEMIYEKTDKLLYKLFNDHQVEIIARLSDIKKCLNRDFYRFI